jgi:taurine dioxygenase
VGVATIPSAPERPVHPSFGVELVEVAAGRLSAPMLARLDAALRRSRLVVVRVHGFRESAQLRAASALGTLVGSRRSVSRRWHRPDVRCLVDPAHESRVSQAFYDEQWHADSSWARTGHAVTVLYATEAQPGCATTAFADTAAAYASLDEVTRHEIAAWDAFHHVNRSRTIRYGRRPRSKPDGSHPSARARIVEEVQRLSPRLHARPAEFVDVPGARHPVVTTDDEGRTFARAGDHAYALAGMDEREGLARIDALNRRMTAPEHVYEHRWTAGDLVIFDNLSLLHRRVRPHDPEAQRILRRCVVWRDT